MTFSAGDDLGAAAALGSDGRLSRREAVRRLCLLTVGSAVGASLLTACDRSKPSTPASKRRYGPVDASTFAWPAGLIAMWDFQRDSAGANTVTSHIGSQATTLTARGNKTVQKDNADPGPFGPSLDLDGATVFVKDGDLGALDVSTSGSQITMVNWVNDVARNHDDTGSGMAFRAGSHCEGGPGTARQYGSYFDGYFFLGPSHGHYTPAIVPQDGPTPGYPWNRDYAGSARKYFTGVGQGQWHMEAFTYDGHQIVAYIDGLADIWNDVPEPEPTQPGFTLHQTVNRNPYVLDKPVNGSPTTKRFTIGGVVLGDPPDYPGFNFTKGKLGGVAVFNRALTAEEIMAIRLGTLRLGEPITTYSFEMSAPGTHPLKAIGWTAKEGPDCIDVSDSIIESYHVVRPERAPKAFLQRTSTLIGATWVPLTGLSSTQVEEVRFKLASAKPSAAAQRLLVRVGDKWWASEASYTTKSIQPEVPDWSGADIAKHAMSWDKGQWRQVTIDDGQALGIAAGSNQESITAGPLQAIGFISEGGDGSAVRVTDLELLPA
jgi:hypothetical protein